MNMDTLIPTELFDESPFTGRALEALYGVAYSFLDREQIEEAVRAFRVMVRFAPTDERGWLGLGLCHESIGQTDIASELYGAGSLVSDPRSARCLVALARVLRQSGDDASAADEPIEHALALCEKNDDDVLGDSIRSEWRSR